MSFMDAAAQWLVNLNFMTLLLVCQRYRITMTNVYIRNVPVQHTTDVPKPIHKVTLERSNNIIYIYVKNTPKLHCFVFLKTLFRFSQDQLC